MDISGGSTHFAGLTGATVRPSRYQQSPATRDSARDLREHGVQLRQTARDALLAADEPKAWAFPGPSSFPLKPISSRAASSGTCQRTSSSRTGLLERGDSLISSGFPLGAGLSVEGNMLFRRAARERRNGWPRPRCTVSVAGAEGVGWFINQLVLDQFLSTLNVAKPGGRNG